MLMKNDKMAQYNHGQYGLFKSSHIATSLLSFHLLHYFVGEIIIIIFKQAAQYPKINGNTGIPAGTGFTDFTSLNARVFGFLWNTVVPSSGADINRSLFRSVTYLHTVSWKQNCKDSLLTQYSKFMSLVQAKPVEVNIILCYRNNEGVREYVMLEDVCKWFFGILFSKAKQNKHETHKSNTLPCKLFIAFLRLLLTGTFFFSTILTVSVRFWIVKTQIFSPSITDLILFLNKIIFWHYKLPKKKTPTFCIIHTLMWQNRIVGLF